MMCKLHQITFQLSNLSSNNCSCSVDAYIHDAVTMIWHHVVPDNVADTLYIT